MSYDITRYSTFEDFIAQWNLDLAYYNRVRDSLDSRTFGGTRERVSVISGWDYQWSMLIEEAYFVDCIGHQDQGEDPMVWFRVLEGVHLSDIALDLLHNQPYWYRKLFYSDR